MVFLVYWVFIYLLESVLENVDTKLFHSIPVIFELYFVLDIFLKVFYPMFLEKKGHGFQIYTNQETTHFPQYSAIQVKT